MGGTGADNWLLSAQFTDSVLKPSYDYLLLISSTLINFKVLKGDTANRLLRGLVLQFQHPYAPARTHILRV